VAGAPIDYGTQPPAEESEQEWPQFSRTAVVIRRERSRRVLISTALIFVLVLAASLWWMGRAEERQVAAKIIASEVPELTASSEVLDVDRQGIRDRDDYIKLRLSPAAFPVAHNALQARFAGTSSVYDADWPWPVPADAVEFASPGRGHGQAFMFSPSTRLVYVYLWTE
jgi:hypothetical protein